MRWAVDVTLIGQAEKESLQVDADTWQAALQTARVIRNESADVSGFTFDVFEGGCRAVDPSSRSRYEVRKAEDGQASEAGPRAVARVAGAPRPATMTAVPKKTIMGFAAVPAAPAPAPASTAAAPAPATAASTPAAAFTPALRSEPPGLSSQIVFKREQDRTSAIPLTYREYVFVVPLGTNEIAAEALLRRQLERVQTSLERMPLGKLVNLAVFDAPFQGRPTARPVATLTWKDWQGTSAVAFPRRSERPPPPPPPKPPAPTDGEAPHAAAPTEAANVLPAAVAFPPNAQPATGPGAPVRPRLTPGRGVRLTPGRGVRAAGARVRGEDLIAELFEAMHDLHFLRDAIEGAEFCLNLSMQEIPCHAGLVHVFDLDRREFVTTNAYGASVTEFLLQRHSENDAMLAAAMRKRSALVVPNAEQGDAASVPRYTAMGGAHSVIVAPVMQAGRSLAAIELINPLDGLPFTEPEGDAMTYIAEQFAGFIGSHGLVLDPERIRARRATG
jgi:hypothetical protein